MTEALRALLSGLIDYAGLFPPAKLPLEESIRNYARYRTEPEAWILGRFICPASRLHELLRYQDELFTSGPPLVISALGRGGETSVDFLESWWRDMQDIMTFQFPCGPAFLTSRLPSEADVELGSEARNRLEFSMHWERETRALQKTQRMRALVDGYEVKLPEELIHATASDTLDPLMQKCATFIQIGYPDESSCFFEATSFVRSANGALHVIDKIQHIYASELLSSFFVECPAPRRIGLKLRCGGLDAAAFPSSSLLASVLARTGVTLKCTAGLHHPIRRWDADLQTHMHGFINVFAAGMLAEKHKLDASRIEPILDDQDAGNFVFSDAGLRWNDLEISTAEIVSARKTRMTSFGSCSFDEPREDLRALGWL